jgi:hypothetical protein
MNRVRDTGSAGRGGEGNHVSTASRSQSHRREFLGPVSTALAHELEVVLRARDDKAVLTPKSPGGADDHAVCVEGALRSGSVAQVRLRQRWASAVPSQRRDVFGTFGHFCNPPPVRGITNFGANFNSVTILRADFSVSKAPPNAGPYEFQTD